MNYGNVNRTKMICSESISKLETIYCSSLLNESRRQRARGVLCVMRRDQWSGDVMAVLENQFSVQDVCDLPTRHAPFTKSQDGAADASSVPRFQKLP